MLVWFSERQTKQQKLVFVALIFCLFGDVWLMLDPPITWAFYAGTGKFLIAHAFYISSFSLDISCYGLINSPLKKKALRAILITLIYIIKYYNIYAGWGGIEGVMRVFIVIYGTVMPLSAVTAILRSDDGPGGKEAYWKFVVGATLFVISDSLISYFRFHQNVKADGIRGFLIMATYYVGQTLIFLGSSFTKNQID